MPETRLKKLEQENTQLKALMASAAHALVDVSSGLRFTAKRLQGISAACSSNAEKVEAIATTLHKAAGNVPVSAEEVAGV